jgi:L-ascorbate metabolism protein UlaG (beta-lactamase superfamily)
MRAGPDRQPFAIAVLGGPTTVVDIAGRRLVIDPTFDPPGPHDYLTKTAGPAVEAAALGAVDAVLISHDQHLDNFDQAGRAFALTAPRILTHPGAAARLGGSAVGLAPWQSIELGDLTVHAVPAVHGPADGERDETGNVNCEVTGFVLAGAGIPTVYLSGDNASLRTVHEIANRFPTIDVAVLFVGAARVPRRAGGRPLTLTSARAAAAAEVLAARTVVPAHTDSWAHFTETVDDVVAAFEQAGISDVLAHAPLGEWIVP